MKIFIIYASAGAGHRKAAEAIFNHFKSKSPSDDVRLIDILEKCNRFYAKGYVGGYRFLINHAAWAWSGLFNVTAAKSTRLLAAAIIKSLDLINSKKFCEFIVREQPDIVISTHFMPPEILGHLKQKGKIKTRLITVITDFGVHPLWVNSGTDTYVVASSLSKEYLLKKDIGNAQVWELGIPIDKNFSAAHDKKTTKRKLGLSPDKFTLLITTGSFGIGPVKEIIASLCGEIQIIVVCAKNKKLYSRLISAAFAGVKVFGFVDNIYELMSASDIVIAKPGGLTTSEILSMELVPVFISPIPGQEMHNLAVMQQFGVGKYGACPEEIKKIVLDYRDNPAKLAQEKEIIKKIKKPHSAEDLYNALR
ncbi:MAG: glycosyltransferase [Candidatus Omnitrophota bacterium]